MSDLLRHLAAHALDLPRSLQLRVPAMFEPAEPAFDTDSIAEIHTEAAVGLRSEPAVREPRQLAEPQLAPPSDAATTPRTQQVSEPPSTPGSAKSERPLAPEGAPRTGHVFTPAAPTLGTQAASARVESPLMIELQLRAAEPEPELEEILPARAAAMAPLQPQPVTRERKQPSASPVRSGLKRRAELAEPTQLDSTPPPFAAVPSLPAMARASSVATSRSPQPTAAAVETTVSISIGRIDVRAQTEASPERRSVRGSPVMTLDAYMRKRRRGEL